MCWRTSCKSCGKPSFGGCGAHVEQVLSDVPREQRCRCREERSASASSKVAEQASGAKKSWWPF